MLQVTFKGTHDHTHGRQMMDFVRSITMPEGISAIVLDLLYYDYVFGDDVAGLFLVGHDRAHRRMRPVCILAQGRTRASLRSLWAAAGRQMASVVDVTFAGDQDEVAGWMRSKGLG